MEDKVIVIQLDCLMAKDRLSAFRKSLLNQMKEGLVVVPPWAHVAYVGDECAVEIKEEKNAPTKADKMAKQILADLAGMSVNDYTDAIHNRLIFGKRNNTLPAIEKGKTSKWIIHTSDETPNDAKRYLVFRNSESGRRSFCIGWYDCTHDGDLLWHEDDGNDIIWNVIYWAELPEPYEEGEEE